MIALSLQGHGESVFDGVVSRREQQRFALARALVNDPELILADEPTGNLHSDQGKEIMEMFKRLNDEGTTIVQVTHSELNAGYGNRIVRLEDGWIRERVTRARGQPPGPSARTGR